MRFDPPVSGENPTTVVLPFIPIPRRVGWESELGPRTGIALPTPLPNVSLLLLLLLLLQRMLLLLLLLLQLLLLLLLVLRLQALTHGCPGFG